MLRVLSLSLLLASLATDAHAIGDGLHHGGDLAQAVVAGLVPVRVVILLEPVHVHYD